jgi:predicted helicase
MDNERDYGARFFQLSYKEAIKQRIITDYKILTMTVSDRTAAREAPQRDAVGRLTGDAIRRHSHQLRTSFLAITAVRQNDYWVRPA